jgi:hypothetical protein
MSSDLILLSQIFLMLLISAGSILAIFRINHHKILGLRELIAVNFFCAFGIFIIYTLESFLGSIYSNILGYSFYSLGYLFFYIGLQKFNSEKIKKKIIFLSFGVFLIILIFVNTFINQVSGTIIVNSTYILFLSIVIISNIKKNYFLNNLGGKIFSIFIFGTSISSLIQIFDNLFYFKIEVNLINPTFSDFIFLFWGSLACLFYIIGIIIIINDRKKNKLQNKIKDISEFYNLMKENLIYQKEILNLISYNFLEPLSSINLSNNIIKKEITNKNLDDETKRIDRSVDKLIKETKDSLKSTNLITSKIQNEIIKISVIDILGTITKNYEISYENYLDTKESYAFINKKLFLLLMSNLIYNFVSISKKISNIEMYSHSIGDHIEIQIAHDVRLDSWVIFNQLNIKKFSNKKVTSETFNTDLIEEILNKLNIKTEYRVGKKRNILILKLKRSLDDC